MAPALCVGPNSGARFMCRPEQKGLELFRMLHGDVASFQAAPAASVGPKMDLLASGEVQFDQRKC